MSGHSKWSTIKRKKGAEDVKRGKIFTRLGREITIAARSGNGDPDSNPALRLAVTRAKAANMPKENIERAIKKGTGELEGGAMDEVTYEAYGPHGIPILIQCMTDNRNRTVSDLRRVFNKHGGNLAESGAVSWMFDTKGYITVERTAKQDPDELFMVAVEAGADDVQIGDESIEIYTSADELHVVSHALSEKGLTVEEATLSKIPKNEIELDSKDTVQVLNLIELLEELDDVDEVFSGLAVSDSMIEELS